MRKPITISRSDKLFIRNEVLKALRPGQANAITAKQLAKRLFLDDDRAIRVVIRELIAEGSPIASSVSKPMGYFIAERLSEVQSYSMVLKSRLVEDAYRLRDFRRAARTITQPEQLELALIGKK